MLATVLELRFHHLGLAVSAPDAAERFLTALGYELGPSIYDPLQGVNLGMCWHSSMPAVELIWADKNRSSPISKMLEQREGLVYHICYSTTDIEKSLADMSGLGL